MLAPRLRLVAENVAFSPTLLVGPAGVPLVGTMNNREAGIPHGVAIWTRPPANDGPLTTPDIVPGAIVNGPTTFRYDVPISGRASSRTSARSTRRSSGHSPCAESAAPIVRQSRAWRVPSAPLGRANLATPPVPQLLCACPHIFGPQRQADATVVIGPTGPSSRCASAAWRPRASNVLWLDTPGLPIRAGWPIRVCGCALRPVPLFAGPGARMPRLRRAPGCR